MTNKEINIAIAIEMGWKADFVNDLNAMHKVEKQLTNYGYRKFDYELTKMKNGDCENPNVCRCKSAPAHQRAEAVCKALGIWKD